MLAPISQVLPHDCIPPRIGVRGAKRWEANPLTDVGEGGTGPWTTEVASGTGQEKRRLPRRRHTTLSRWDGCHWNVGCEKYVNEKYVNEKYVNENSCLTVDICTRIFPCAGVAVSPRIRD